MTSARVPTIPEVPWDGAACRTRWSTRRFAGKVEAGGYPLFTTPRGKHGQGFVRPLGWTETSLSEHDHGRVDRDTLVEAIGVELLTDLGTAPRAGDARALLAVASWRAIGHGCQCLPEVALAATGSHVPWAHVEMAGARWPVVELLLDRAIDLKGHLRVRFHMTWRPAPPTDPGPPWLLPRAQGR
jgi:hypothetical protein